MNRRELLTLGAAGILTTLAGRSAQAAIRAGDDYCTLWLRRPESGESVRATYWANGQIVPDNFLLLSYILRDVHDDQTVVMDRALVDLLFVLQQFGRSQTGRDEPLDVLSGFRTVEYNRTIEGAAENSEHTHARATDFRQQGVAPSAMASYARSLQLGGVGEYDRFTHVDINRVRRWRGPRSRPKA